MVVELLEEEIHDAHETQGGAKGGLFGQRSDE